MASNLEAVSMIADIGQQQWSCTNFRLSDRTLRSRDRILEFSQEFVKICAAANNFDFRVYFGMSGRYKQPVQYGRDSAHKSEAAWAVFSLGVCMRERQHIYEDLNESSSASPGGSQQLEIPPSLNSKRATNFFQIRWYFTRRGDFNARQDSIICLYFCKTPTFCKSAHFSVRRQYFPNPPIFWKSADILEIRQYFGNPPIFWKSANILEICIFFCEAPTFFKSAYFLKRERNLWIRLIFVTANICVYFQYLFMHLSMRLYFWRNCFNLRFKIDVVVIIIWSIVIIINFVLTL